MCPLCFQRKVKPDAANLAFSVLSLSEWVSLMSLTCCAITFLVTQQPCVHACAHEWGVMPLNVTHPFHSHWEAFWFNRHASAMSLAVFSFTQWLWLLLPVLYLDSFLTDTYIITGEYKISYISGLTFPCYEFTFVQMFLCLKWNAFLNFIISKWVVLWVTVLPSGWQRVKFKVPPARAVFSKLCPSSTGFHWYQKHL